MRHWALKGQKQWLRVDPGADSDQAQKFDVDAASAVEAGVASVGERQDHSDEGMAIHVASWTHSVDVDVVAGGGMIVVPSEPACRLTQETHSVVVRNH